MTEQGATDRMRLVEAYIAAAQRARGTQAPADLEVLRTFLAPDLEIKLASPWTDTPWRVASTSANQVLRRFTDPINRGTSLTTETVNLVAAGEDVLVEQLSTISRDGAAFVSMVCHIFAVSDGRISAIRTYRNEHGLPPG